MAKKVLTVACIPLTMLSPSGKTHTMLGSDSDPGTIPRVVQQMFDCIEQTPDREYLIRVSYMEIYREVGGRRDRSRSRCAPGLSRLVHQRPGLQSKQTHIRKIKAWKQPEPPSDFAGEEMEGDWF